MATVALAMLLLTAAAPSRMPVFSWDTLPVGWHSCNTSGVWSHDQVGVHILRSVHNIGAGVRATTDAKPHAVANQLLRI